MLCPYNGFKEMDCEKCAAHEVDDTKVVRVEHNGETVKTIMESKCKLVQNGAPVPSLLPRPMYFIDDARQEDDLK